jgi:hypothetical protein
VKPALIELGLDGGPTEAVEGLAAGFKRVDMFACRVGLLDALSLDSAPCLVFSRCQPAWQASTYILAYGASVDLVGARIVGPLLASVRVRRTR